MPKGSEAALWNLAFNTGVWRGDVRTFLRIRRNAIDAIKSAAALRLSPCLCVLRPDGGASALPEEVPWGCTNCGEIVGTYGITNVLLI